MPNYSASKGEVGLGFHLRLQDPSIDAHSLLELILVSCAYQRKGAGVFAFATEKGVKLLFDDRDFQKFLSGGHFDLIVGVDAVTTPAALSALDEMRGNFDGLRVRAFVHSRRGALFHPKFCWFSNGDEGRVLLGSGNLTTGGLLTNWEAFGEAHIAGDDLRDLVNVWDSWVRHNEVHLLDISHEDVLERARENARDVHRRHEENLVEEMENKLITDVQNAEVLIAEIPAGKGRWNQANFDKKTYMSFFQLIPGRRQRVVLIPILSDGTVGDLEVRPGVSVKSKNYRIELGLASGLEYPDGASRPIAAFLRTGSRRFRYRLLMPEDDDYSQTLQFLRSRWKGPLNRMKRISVSLSESRRALPHLTGMLEP